MSVVADWCAAHGLDPEHVDATLLDYFASEVPLGRTRLAQSAAHLRRRGAVLPRRPVGSLDRGADRLGVGEAIARCPVTGRLGVRGRRDALVLTLLDAELNRTHVAGLRPEDVVSWQVAGRELAAGPDERSCPRCVLARWLNVRCELPPVGTRSGAARATWTEGEGHCCTGPVRVASTTPGALLPGLDQHGWPSMSNLGPRAITAIVTARTDPQLPELEPTSDPSCRPSPGVDVVETKREIDHLLDELDDRLGQIEATQPGVTRHSWSV